MMTLYLASETKFLAGLFVGERAFAFGLYLGHFGEVQSILDLAQEPVFFRRYEDGNVVNTHRLSVRGKPRHGFAESL